MTRDLLLLADGISDYFPWYTWVLALALVAILIGYKMYQKKMMG